MAFLVGKKFFRSSPDQLWEESDSATGTAVRAF